MNSHEPLVNLPLPSFDVAQDMLLYIAAYDRFMNMYIVSVSRLTLIMSDGLLNLNLNR